MKLFLWVIISLVLHLGIYFLFKEAPRSYHRPTEIEIVYEKNFAQKTRQVVVSPQERLKQKLKKLKRKAQLLSQESQRYKNQQIASKTGKTKNKSQKQKSKNYQKLDDLLPELKKQLGKGLVKNPEPSPSQLKFEDQSTTFDDVPHIKKGGFTALNSDQFVFYTFYARTSQQIGTRWSQNVVNYSNKLKILDLYQLAKTPSNTYLEIVIDKDGHFVKAIVHKSSGDIGLDQTAIDAFKQASPLNNPPEEMVNNKDGLIHLKYSFHIEWDPRLFARRYK